jgi:lysozyme family protein
MLYSNIIYFYFLITGFAIGIVGGIMLKSKGNKFISDLMLGTFSALISGIIAIHMGNSSLNYLGAIIIAALASICMMFFKGFIRR